MILIGLNIMIYSEIITIKPLIFFLFTSFYSKSMPSMALILLFASLNRFDIFSKSL